jgi:hypothetical protein
MLSLSAAGIWTGVTIPLTSSSDLTGTTAAPQPGCDLWLG